MKFIKMVLVTRRRCSWLRLLKLPMTSRFAEGVRLGAAPTIACLFNPLYRFRVQLRNFK